MSDRISEQTGYVEQVSDSVPRPERCAFPANSFMGFVNLKS